MSRFEDFTSECLSFKSNWQKERSTTENETQTADVQSTDVECQSFERLSVEVQVDAMKTMEPVENPDWMAVGQFLKRVEPTMLKAIQDNINTAVAFNRYARLMAGHDDTSVRKTHSLRHAALDDTFAVLALDWNCSGTTVAAGYGVGQHEDWCSHKGAVCTWNVERRQMQPSKADTFVDVDACLTALAFHPSVPAILAAATYAGEIVICNLANPEGTRVVVERKAGDDGHKDAVNCLRWVSAAVKEYTLASVGQDGRLLMWTLPSRGSELQLSAAFAINVGSLPRSLRAKVSNTDKEAGLTSVAFSHKDKDLVLAAGETGAVLHCNLNVKDPVGQLGSSTIHNPVVLGLLPHSGTVYSAAASKSHRNLFLTAGGDGCVRIYNILKLEPLLNVDLNAGILYSVEWSPARPTVFAVGSADGHVCVFDLMANESKPVLKISCDTDQKAVHCVSFNPQRPDVLGTGDGRGVVHIWLLGSDFVMSPANEMAKLDQLAMEKKEDN